MKTPFLFHMEPEGLRDLKELASEKNVSAASIIRKWVAIGMMVERGREPVVHTCERRILHGN